MSRLHKLTELSKKKKLVGVGMLAVVLCCSLTVANLGGEKDKALDTNSLQVTDNSDSQIPEHDGDVLVDSLNISSLPGNSDKIPGTTTDTALVTSDDISDLSNTDTYFEEVRATVNMDRNQILSMLTDVIAEATSNSEKENATQQKLKLIDYMDKEKVIESLIETKGLPQCLVLITDNAVNVTVNKQDLTQSDVAKICDIVMRETERNASQIVIQSKF